MRDRQAREVEFLVTVEGRPWFAVEARLGDTAVSPHLRAFREALGIPFAYQVVREGRRDFVERGVRCVPAGRFLAALA